MLNWVTNFRLESTSLDAMTFNKEIREMIVGGYHSHRYRYKISETYFSPM